MAKGPNVLWISSTSVICSRKLGNGDEVLAGASGKLTVELGCPELGPPTDAAAAVGENMVLGNWNRCNALPRALLAVELVTPPCDVLCGL